jgi:uncharacterized protein YukE
VTRPGDSVEGITVPQGDPDALRTSASQLQGVSTQLEDQASRLRSMPSFMGPWAGPGSSAFAQLTGVQSADVGRTGTSMFMASLTVSETADSLEDAQRAAEKAIDRARTARHEIDRAKEDIRRAVADQATARDRMATAALARSAARLTAGNPLLDPGGVAAAAADAADREYRAAEHDLHAAEGRERRARVRLKDAEDDLEQARKDGADAAQDAEDSALVLQMALRTLPVGALDIPGAPAYATMADDAGVPRPVVRDVPIEEMEPPKGWWGPFKTIYKIGRGEVTVLHGTYQLGKGAYEHPDQVPGALWNTGKNMATHPIASGKAIIGYDELAHGRYADWVGQMGIGALAGGGFGEAAARGTRLTRVMGEPKLLPTLGPRAAVNGRAFAGRRIDFTREDLGARPGTKVKPLDPDVRAQLARAYPRGVRYTRAGHPIFTPYAEKRVVVDGLNGKDRTADNRLANQAIGEPGTEAPAGYRWHHVEDGKTMELVPKLLHEKVRHTGGASAIEHGQIGLFTPGSEFSPFEERIGASAGGLGFAGTELAGGAP